LDSRCSGKKRSGLVYGRADGELLETFAEQLALVIENTELVKFDGGEGTPEERGHAGARDPACAASLFAPRHTQRRAPAGRW
jgi:hypothetical protein